jgi:hypothetical protein
MAVISCNVLASVTHVELSAKEQFWQMKGSKPFDVAVKRQAEYL